MKRTKRIFAIFMTLALAMSMLIVSSAVSFAADAPTYSIKITKDATDKVAHTYGAYQVFKGEVDGTQLTKIQWGDNITVDQTLITAINNALELTGNDALTTSSAATAVARAISDANITDDDAKAQALADAFAAAITKDNPKGTVEVAATGTDGTINNLPAGYYLVKDTTAITGEGASTRFILKLTSNTTVNVSEKANVPSVTKKVKETNDTTGDVTGWQDGADYDIGDPIPYKLEGTLPGKFAEFDTYKTYTFVDTLSEGLTPPAAKDVKVTLDTETGTDISSLFDVTVTGQELKVSLKEGTDLKTAKVGDAGFTATSKIIVTYDAVLNDKAKIGSEGNPNEVYLEFSNNPNYDGDGDKGKTPIDKVIVFTYEIKALKIAPTTDAAISQTDYDKLTDAQKADYVKIGEKWQKTAPLEGAEFTLFKKTQGGEVQVGKISTGSTFEFKGTDAGEYVLKETKVPAGYNKADDINITVAATYDTDSADPKLKTLTVTPDTAGFTVTTTAIDGDADHITTNGIISGKVLNTDGAELPATGGIGTIIFYVLGSLLVVGCGIVLISKRRMESR
jgi:fimbrial isopeptide formation D2 family protein/LPXTG-motif cell wall-anchored protein